MNKEQKSIRRQLFKIRRLILTGNGNAKQLGEAVNMVESLIQEEFGYI